MNSFPKIKDVNWLSEMTPVLVEIPVGFVNTNHARMGLDDVEETPGTVYIDLSKLSDIEPYFPNEEAIPVPGKCKINMTGVEIMIIDVDMADMLTIWKFYKEWECAKY